MGSGPMQVQTNIGCSSALSKVDNRPRASVKQIKLQTGI